MITFERVSVLMVAFWFVFYLGIHIAIGLYHKSLTGKLIQNPNDVLIIKQVAFWKLIFRWFPAVFLIFAVISFYALNK